MKCLAVVFAGGSAVLLACAVHDDTNFSNPPQPTDTTPPKRTVVFDSGVVTLLGEAGAGPAGSGGGGEFTPDAAEEPDVVPEIEAPALGGPGSSCDLFASTNPCDSTLGLACYLDPANGTGSCQQDVVPGGPPRLAPYQFCGTGLGTCGAKLFCSPDLGICTNLCHVNQTGECIGSSCKPLTALSTIGYCG